VTEHPKTDGPTKPFGDSVQLILLTFGYGNVLDLAARNTNHVVVVSGQPFRQFVAGDAVDAVVPSDDR